MLRTFAPPVPLRALIVALAVALLVVAGLLAPSPARADDLIEAEPHPGQTVGEAPEMVLLRFDRDLALRKDAHDVAVHDAQGERVDDGHAAVAGYSPRTMIVRLAAAPEDGEVTVRYSVRFASSGETLQGEFAFTVEPGFEAEAAPAVEAGEPRSSQSIVLWTIAVVLAVALFASLLYYLQVETGTAQSSVEEPDPPEH